MKTVKILLATLVLSAAMLSTSAQASERIINLITAFAPGGASDRMLTYMMDAMNKELESKNIRIVRLPKIGAAGMISMRELARTPDGQIQLSWAHPVQYIAPIVAGLTEPYTMKSFTIIGMIGDVPNVLAVGPNGPKSIQEFKSMCQSKSLNYASSGTGSAAHIVSVTMLEFLNCDATHVPYKGSTPAKIDLYAGRVDFISDMLPGIITDFKNNQAVPLAITGSQRSSTIPNVPTFQEVGLGKIPSYWFGISANSNADPSDLALFKQAFSAAMASPQLQQQLTDLGLVNLNKKFPPDILSIEEPIFAKFWAKVSAKLPK